jgi:ParB family transcriptional regulator, chromosome partitioning protein
MSTKSKLLAMTENLQLPEDRVAASEIPLSTTPPPAADNASSVSEAMQPLKFPPVIPGTAAKTGPGQMLQFRGQMLAVEGEMGKLRDRLKEHQDAAPTKRLDTQSIVPSRWANRHSDSFNTIEFARLKQDIELVGGNVQPISVRPLPNQPERYEIVFGHRRHRACSELGIPVLATIETGAVTDLDLFSAMDRENREREDLSPYEQGTMYRRALDEQLYPSNRRLAEALGVSHTWVANVLQVADLPAPVVQCFKTPLDIQHRHAKSLAAALETDRKGVMRRADKLRGQERLKTASAVVAMLAGAAVTTTESAQRPIEIDGKLAGHWAMDGAGRLTVRIDAMYVKDDRHLALLASIAAVLKV